MTGTYNPKEKKQSKFAVLMNFIKAKRSLVGGFLAVVAVCLGVFYLVETNSLSTQGYDVNNLKNRITELENQSRQLELDVAELQSIRNISKRVESLGMVKVAITDYLSPTGSNVAVR